VRLTNAEIESERIYLMEERFGILEADPKPTLEQIELALDEADDWQRRYEANPL
jgi:hypothetical protein